MYGESLSYPATATFQPARSTAKWRSPLMCQLLSSQMGRCWLKANNFFHFPDLSASYFGKLQDQHYSVHALGCWQQKGPTASAQVRPREAMPLDSRPGSGKPWDRKRKRNALSCFPPYSRTLTLFEVAYKKYLPKLPCSKLSHATQRDASGGLRGGAPGITLFSPTKETDLEDRCQGSFCSLTVPPHLPAWVEQPHSKDNRTEDRKNPDDPHGRVYQPWAACFWICCSRNTNPYL